MSPVRQARFVIRRWRVGQANRAPWSPHRVAPARPAFRAAVKPPARLLSRLIGLGPLGERDHGGARTSVRASS
jgi:hypothetical protein